MKSHEASMKPSTRLVLRLLRDHSQTTHDLLVAGCGSRYGARLHELREAGFVISEQRLKHPARGSRYTLVGEPERAAGGDIEADISRAEIPESPSAVEIPRSANGTSEGTSAEAPLFDSSLFTERGGYRDTEAA